MLANTLITMVDGSQKPIQDIQIGETILGYDFETGKTLPTIALDVLPLDFNQHGVYITFSNNETLGLLRGYTLYCVEVGSYLAIEEWREGYHSVDSTGAEIEAMAIYWNVESKDYNTYYTLYSSNNTYFANDIMIAWKPVDKQRRLAFISDTQVLKELVEEESKDTGCFQFTVTDKEFIKKATPFQSNIKTSRRRINDLENQILNINSTNSKLKDTEGEESNSSDLKLKATCFEEIATLESKIGNWEADYNKLLVQYSNLGEDILLSDTERRKKYFRRAVKLANENINLYRISYANTVTDTPVTPTELTTIPEDNTNIIED